jgi:uncharacterized protein YuzE
METKRLKVVYHPDKDILSLIILPRRPSRTSGNEHDFLILYDWDNPDEIVGFEILDFSLLVPHLHEPDVVPTVELRFQVEGTSLTDATLTEVLEWAYRHFVLRYVPAFTAEREEPAEVVGP